MGFLTRHLAFIAIVALSTPIGIVVGLKLVEYKQHPPQSLIVESKQTSNDAIDVSLGEPMHMEEPFLAAPSASSLPASSQRAASVDRSGITADAYLVGDVQTGKVYLSRRSTAALPVASISKLVTALAATNDMSSSTIISLASTSDMADLPADISGIKLGESYDLETILRPLLLSSSNVAAEAIASTSGREGFFHLMSSLAWEIGMPHTFFADPSGLTPENVATADDLFALARYLYRYRPDILAITREATASVASSTEHDAHGFLSTHPFIKDSRFIGGKTGRTPQAGETMITILNIGGQPIAFIVMHADYGYRKSDTEALMRKFIAL